MLEITIPGKEYWDESINEFVYDEAVTLRLEHSLVSLSKWESKWHKSFLSNAEKLTADELIDYVKCMTITQNVKIETYDRLTPELANEIKEYINEPMTAVYFPNEGDGKINNEKITSELVYYWMVTLNIPFECQKWHLNRLIALIKVCNMKNQPSKKMSKKAAIERHRAINEARRKQCSSNQ